MFNRVPDLQSAFNKTLRDTPLGQGSIPEPRARTTPNMTSMRASSSDNTMGRTRPVLTDNMDSSQRKQLFLGRLRDEFNDGSISPEEYLKRKKLLTETLDAEIAQSAGQSRDARITKGQVGTDRRAGQGDERGRMDSRQYSWAKSPEQVSPGFANRLAADFNREVGPNPYVRSR